MKQRQVSYRNNNRNTILWNRQFGLVTNIFSSKGAKRSFSFLLFLREPDSRDIVGYFALNVIYFAVSCH